MHFEALELNFMSTDQCEEVVSLEEVCESLSAVNIGTASLRVAYEFAFKGSIGFINRVRPEDVAYYFAIRFLILVVL